MDHAQQDKRPDRFFRLLMGCQRRLLALALAMTSNLADAEDIVGEATTVMWEKFDEFRGGAEGADDGGAFFAWASAVVRIKVMQYRRTRSRDRVVFSDAMLDQIADEGVSIADHLEDQFRALQRCLGKLTEAERELLRRRYRTNATLKATAESVGRSTVTVRKHLRKIYDALLGCIERTLTSEGKP